MSYLDRLTQRRRVASHDSPYEKNEINEKSPRLEVADSPPSESAVSDRSRTITESLYEINEINEKSPPLPAPFGWRTITLAWPKDAAVPVPKGRWTREPDGTIVAEYTRDELAYALALAGVPIEDGTDPPCEKSEKSPPLEVPVGGS